MSQKAKEEEIAWIRAMVAKEEERFVFTSKPGEFEFYDTAKVAEPRCEVTTKSNEEVRRTWEATLVESRCKICGDEECPHAQSDGVPCIKRKSSAYPAGFAGAAQAQELRERSLTCGCRACLEPLSSLDWTDPRRVWWMVVCPQCGNKRCPRAASHENACSGSNEPGRDGSEK